MAGIMDLRGTRSLAQWLPCLADPSAECTGAKRREIGAKVRASFMGSDRTYGARRVWHDVLADGISCGLHRAQGLEGQVQRIGDILGPHVGAQRPGDDVAREVVEHG